MSTMLREYRVGDLVRYRIARARVLERFGIDYCCAGRKTLADACREHGLGVGEVERALAVADAAPLADSQDWSELPLSELIDHVVREHHKRLRDELPRIAGLLEPVIARYGGQHPELDDVQRVFVAFWEELLTHMLKEEQVLFPLIRRLEQAKREQQQRPPFHCGTIQFPIAVMEDEHHTTGQALAELRSLTDGYTPPPGVCARYRMLMASLEQLEQDLHLHMHKENNILFPRAADLEASLRPAEMAL